jgi:hypothetical protein
MTTPALVSPLPLEGIVHKENDLLQLSRTAHQQLEWARIVRNVYAKCFHAFPYAAGAQPSEAFTALYAQELARVKSSYGHR